MLKLQIPTSGRHKIAHLIDSFARGGAEGLVLETIKSLPDFEHVVILLQGPADLSAELPALVSCFDLQHRGPKYLFSTARRLRKLLRELEASLLHTHLYWSTLMGRLAVGQHLPLVTTYHFADYDTMRGNWKSRLLMHLDRLTYRPDYFTVAVSHYIERVLRERCGFTERLCTIHNFVRDEFYSLSAQPQTWAPPAVLRIVAVGNLKAEKNYELLLAAAALLGEEQVQIDIYGAGPQLSHYQQLVRERGLTNIAFLGRATEVSQLFLSYHLYTMPSFSEACPLTPIEAMAVGLPALLSDIPALREVGGEGAFFFENRNVASWVAVVRNILAGELNPSQRQTAAAQQVQKFAKAHFIDQLTSVYQQALTN
jgi:glycosyltransferase involved in cell wall biosynthesis